MGSHNPARRSPAPARCHRRLLCATQRRVCLFSGAQARAIETLVAFCRSPKETERSRTGGPGRSTGPVPARRRRVRREAGRAVRGGPRREPWSPPAPTLPCRLRPLPLHLRPPPHLSTLSLPASLAARGLPAPPFLLSPGRWRPILDPPLGTTRADRSLPTLTAQVEVGRGVFRALRKGLRQRS